MEALSINWSVKIAGHGDAWITVATTISVLTILIIIIWWAALPKPIPGIPYNAASTKRILGDVPDMKKANGVRFWMLDQFVKHNSPIVQIFVDPLRKPRIIVSDFTEAYDVLTHRGDFDKSTLTSDSFSGVVAASFISMKTSDRRFKANKELVRDLMTPSFLHEVSAPEIYEKVLLLLELWDVKTQKGNGRPFQADRDIYNLALDIIVSAAFDFPLSRCTIVKQIAHLKTSPEVKSTHSQDAMEPFPFEAVSLDPELQACIYLTESIGVSFQSVFPRLAHWLYLKKPRSKRAMRLKEQLIATNIEKAIKRLEEQGEGRETNLRCAVDQLLLREKTIAEKQGLQPNFHKRAIYDELFGYIVGGHDTTSATLSWWVKFMARHQSSQSRLRKDLYDAFTSAFSEARLPSISEITRSQIPYLDAIIEETHRCAHIVPTVIRQSTVDTQLLGYPIPKGTHVFFYTNGASFMQPAFDIPHGKRTDSGRNTENRFGTWDPVSVREFAPERWLRKEKSEEDGIEWDVFNPQAGPQMAFGAGPRGCFGRRLAYLEIRITIVLLLWRFEFLELDDKLGDFEGVDFFAVTPRHCYVKLRKIT